MRKALELLEKRIDNDRMNSSLGDLVRLLEISRNWEGDQSRTVRVQWVQPQWEQPKQ